MVAVLKVFYDFGGTDTAPGTNQDTSALSPNLRFKTADNATIDTNHPIPVPTTGKNRSYWKQIYLKCSTAPSTQIDNVKFYSDGSSGFGTGIALKIATSFPVKNSGANTGYEVSTGTTGVTGTRLAAVHAGVSTTASVFNYTAAAPISPSISESGNIINAAGETTNYVILQMEVSSTASSGALSAETLTWQWDEI